MRNLLLIFAAAMFFSSCSGGGGQNTLITNPSAEEGVGSSVTGWLAESGRGGMIAFYDCEA
ncbi:MAG TPA: hypothetical protein PKE28_08780, partial [Bacteroidales bacterium]|nr:hypothetical protein [Bacteroidales bacterium]